MTKGIPWGFYQGNRSEYLAIPALSKLGFTIPVPRQEDRFGVDFIVHLASVRGNIVTPLGKSFSIQIKSKAEPLAFQHQEERDCLFDSSIPFFIGVVSRKKLSLKVYSTLNKWCFFWMKGRTRSFQLIFKSTGKGLTAPDYDEGKVWTGKPILKIKIQEPSTVKARWDEINELQSTMISWLNLENQIISLKEQQVPIVWRPTAYITNHPLELRGDSRNKLLRVAYFNPKTLPNICVAAEIALDSLSCYLKDSLNREPQTFGKELMDLIKQQFAEVENVRKRSQQIRTQIQNQQAKKGKD